MQVATGTVVAGKLVVEGLDLPDGETVVVLTREVEDEVHLSPEAWAPNRPASLSVTCRHSVWPSARERRMSAGSPVRRQCSIALAR